MLSREEFENLFNVTADQPAAWIELARTLRLGARPIIAHLQEIRDVSQNVGQVRLEKLGCVRAYMLLTAVAFENLLKAIAVRRGLLTVDRGRLRSQTGSTPRGGHGLTEIASNLELDLSPAEIDLLRRLEEYLIWAARYPVPKHVEHYVRTQTDRLLTLRSGDLEVGDGLFDKLSSIAAQSA